MNTGNVFNSRSEGSVFGNPIILESYSNLYGLVAASGIEDIHGALNRLHACLVSWLVDYLHSLTLIQYLSPTLLGNPAIAHINILLQFHGAV